ncbi:hypothetical protein BG015_008481 [Linnemannia schmuckeri]|uniref:N-acetyltransferase domain-containing protein n=1 Tax=Linnemannia schmuckeri TaxID=64567 RepID=A0A9P5RYZ0_9FUNG|nr:hypothetical protein BG015_008481 [Linnemannia schmuckeri]
MTATTENSASTVVVRLARPEDDALYGDDIYRIVNTAYRSDAGWTNESHLVAKDRISRTEVKLVLADTINPVLLAFSTSSPAKVIGTLQLDPVEHYPDFGHYTGSNGYSFDYSTAETVPRTEQIMLGLISVDPTQQSRGTGRKLVEAGLKHAREVMGRKQAVVYVLFQRTELREWYQRIGFVDYGEKRPFLDVNSKQEGLHFSVLRLAL